MFPVMKRHNSVSALLVAGLLLIVLSFWYYHRRSPLDFDSESTDSSQEPIITQTSAAQEVRDSGASFRNQRIAKLTSPPNGSGPNGNVLSASGPFESDNASTLGVLKDLRQQIFTEQQNLAALNRELSEMLSIRSSINFLENEESDINARINYLERDLTLLRQDMALIDEIKRSYAQQYQLQTNAAIVTMERNIQNIDEEILMLQQKILFLELQAKDSTNASLGVSTIDQTTPSQTLASELISVNLRQSRERIAYLQQQKEKLRSEIRVAHVNRDSNSLQSSIEAEAARAQMKQQESELVGQIEAFKKKKEDLVLRQKALKEHPLKSQDRIDVLRLAISAQQSLILDLERRIEGIDSLSQ